MLVKELIEKLSQYPGDTEVKTYGPDCGGYDTEAGDFNVFYVDNFRGYLWMYHSDDWDDPNNPNHGQKRYG